MDEETITALDHELCDSCDVMRAAICYMTQGEVLEEWACIGKITTLRSENDIHDQMNTIRLCVIKPQGGITAHEWTPWEASVVALLLNEAVARHLEDGQPTVE
ncbi:unnamed protein product, partial [marine sediment metagenome]